MNRAMISSRRRRVAAAPAALVAALAVTLAGCGSDGSAEPVPPAGPAAGGGDQQLLAIGRRYAQCVRQHGVPGYPDMQVVDGRLVLPDGAAGDAAWAALRGNKAAQSACQPILAEAPASARKGDSATPEDLQRLRRFARCIREHGVPEWPDPEPNGAFPVAGTPLEPEANSKTGRVPSAVEACEQFWDKGFSVK